jgi:hypothetical protein
MKIPENVRKALEALPQEKREKVRAIVRRHVDACRRVGVELEFMDRVWIEAIEAVEIEENFKDPYINDEWPEYTPIRSYDVYRSPRVDS